MLDRLLTFITNHKLISPEDTVLLAVSGGLDSMVMMHVFAELQKKLQLHLRVVHVNHNLRGQASDLDEQLVKKESRLLGLPCSVKRLQGFDLKSSEEDLRAARYALFNEWLAEAPAARLATAHHLDDQIETFFMRLARGSGQKGLLGIPLRRERFIRPFLFLRRKELAAYAIDRQIAFREDKSNLDTAKLRNNIRHNLTPHLMRVFGESFYKGFARSLADLQAGFAAYGELSAGLFDANLQWDGENILCETAFYKTLQPKLRRGLFDYCILKLSPVNSSLSQNAFEEFDSFVQQAQTGSVFLFGGLKVFKNRASLLFSAEQSGPIETAELYAGKQAHFAGNIISATEVDYEQVRFSPNRDEEYICADTLDWPLTIRRWREGDFFYPLGLGKKQKLSDFFVNSKIERWQKSRVALVCNRNEIVWLAGLRLDDRYKIRGNCKRCYLLKTRKEGE